MNLVRIVSAATIFVASAPSLAAVHVHYVVVPIVTGGVRGRMAPPEPSVELPMEITNAPLMRDSGEIGRDQIVAHHTFRVMDAAVLLQPVEGREGEIPAGTALAGIVQHDGKMTRKLYCDLRHGGVHRNQAYWSCFSDSNGEGKFDDFWVGLAGDAYLGFATDPYDLTWKRKLAAPAAYRKATLDERPTGLIGYSWCGGDGLKDPPRFTVSASWPNGFWEMAEARSCTFGQWKGPPENGQVEIDRIIGVFKPGSQPNTLDFKIESRIPPGAIAPLHPNGGIREMAAVAAQTSQDVEEMRRPPFVPSGEPAEPTSGPIKLRQVFFSIGVKHALTGVLKNEVQLGRYPFFVSERAHSGDGLQPGQIVYGAEVGGSIRPQLVWCAPQKDAAGRWTDAACLPDSGRGTIMIRAAPAMMGAANLVIPELLPPYVAEPAVERRPVDLPPMVMSYAFAGWDRDKAKIDIRLDWGDGPKKVQEREWAVDVSGAARIPVVGGEIVLTQDAKGDGAIAGPFSPSPIGRDATAE